MTTHARSLARKSASSHSRQSRWPLHVALALAVTAASSSISLRQNIAAPLEPPIIPTVHPAVAPTTAIPVPLVVRADQTSVWKSDLEQRMLVSGRVLIEVGYRQLRADNAALWITPSHDYGENIFDVAIYLSGHISLAEGNRSDSTLTTGNELLVTTRISRQVQLAGPAPVSKIEESNPIFTRGGELRQELLNRPLAELFAPPPFIETTIEAALQAGWIARGPNNRIIAGPGDVLAQRDASGRIQIVQPPKPAKAARPQSTALVATDQPIHRQRVGNEYLNIIHNPYMLWDFGDGKTPPIEFRAQHMVAFTPAPETATTKAAATQPGAKGGGGSPDKLADSFEEASKVITGVYLEGDVSFQFGDKTREDDKGSKGAHIGGNQVRAARIYVDFLSQRAIMLDATLSAVDQERNVPLYMRAEQIRMLSRSEFAAKKATFSTSEFYTPHYSIGAGDIYLQNLAANEEGSGGGGGLDSQPCRTTRPPVTFHGRPPSWSSYP
ncbi:MAG: hypothetical protein FWD61_19745, partial [Phycisphaerales bacterium]|nr:hypothetical protein [Phycisphaerales bacterium]